MGIQDSGDSFYRNFPLQILSGRALEALTLKHPLHRLPWGGGTGGEGPGSQGRGPEHLHHPHTAGTKKVLPALGPAEHEGAAATSNVPDKGWAGGWWVQVPGPQLTLD